MIVSKLLTAVLEPAIAFAPVACQNPVEVSMEWYSIEPVYLDVSVPPRKSVEPEEASLKPKTPVETLPSLMSVLKKGF
jgi:hypothetical protein